MTRPIFLFSLKAIGTAKTRSGTLEVFRKESDMSDFAPSEAVLLRTVSASGGVILKLQTGSALANKPSPSARHAQNQSVSRHLVRDDSPGANHGKLADADTTK